MATKVVKLVLLIYHGKMCLFECKLLFMFSLENGLEKAVKIMSK